MSTRDRRLRSDFVEFMRERNAWPLTKNFVGWMRKHGGGIKNGRYAPMKRGEPTDPRYVVGLVRCTLGALATRPEDEGAQALIEYLSARRVENVNDYSAATIAEMLLEPDDDEDYIKRGVLGVLDSLFQKRLVPRLVEACSTELNVAAAVRWMFVWVGRQVDERADQLPIEASIAAAETYMRTSYDAYVARAVSWWRYDPWTVVQARGKQTPTGVTIVLPLREAAYEDLKQGRRMSYDVGPHELHRPSRNLLIEALAERPPELDGVDGNTTKNTLNAVVSQVGVLSHCRAEEAHRPLRLLTFAGSRLNRERAVSFGFQPVGTTMRDTGLEFFEKKLAWPYSPQDLILLGLLGAIGICADQMLRPPIRSAH